MAVIAIDGDEFDRAGPARHPVTAAITREVGWYRATDTDLIGSVVYDKSDKDYAYVILAPDGKGEYRWIGGRASIADEEAAGDALVTEMTHYERTGQFTEVLYSAGAAGDQPPEVPALITDINEEVKRYLASHPEALHALTPRKFEELIASILKDFGFDVELTQASRDGGRDIIAHLRNAVTSYLTYVECKKYAAGNKVGVGIIREVTGVHHLRKANKSLIVTTSSFTRDAVEESKLIEHALDLKDYDGIKSWLERYK